jgi:hypothetical protein
MNKRDEDNLNFLLYASEEVLRDWHSRADADDLAYAQELLAIKAADLKEQSLAVRIEAEMALDPSFTLATEVLKKFYNNKEQK